MSLKVITGMVAATVLVGAVWWWTQRGHDAVPPTADTQASTAPPQQTVVSPAPPPATAPAPLSPAERISALTGFSPDFLWPFERERLRDAAVANISHHDGLHVFDGYQRMARYVTLTAYGPYQGEISWESLESSTGSCHFRWCGIQGGEDPVSHKEGGYPVIVMWSDSWKWRYDVKRDTSSATGVVQIPPIIKALILKDMVWLNYHTFRSAIYREYIDSIRKAKPDGTYSYFPCKTASFELFPDDFTTAFLHFEPMGPTVIRPRWEKVDKEAGIPLFSLDHLAYWYKPQPGSKIMNPADIESKLLTRAEHILGGISEGRPRAWRIQYHFSSDLPPGSKQAIPEP